MATLSNTFDGGTDTQSITTGNSGGASGNAFTIAGGVYSSTHAHSTSLAGKIAAAATANLGWDTLTISTDVYVRFYLWLGGSPTSSDILFQVTSSTAAGGTTRGYIGITGARNIFIVCGADVSSNIGAVPTGQFVRIEARWSTTAGAELRLYNSADSGTVTASISVTTNMATPAVSTIVSTLGSNTDLWVDDFAVSTDGWLGSTVALPRLPLISSAAVHRAATW